METLARIYWRDRGIGLWSRRLWVGTKFAVRLSGRLAILGFRIAAGVSNGLLSFLGSQPLRRQVGPGLPAEEVDPCRYDIQFRG